MLGWSGTYRVLMGQPSYIKAVPGSDTKLPGSAKFAQVTAKLREDRLVVAGPSEQRQACLEKAYDRLVACCYDLSSKSQIEKKQTYNFYYDSAKDCFVSFP